ncbi:MAG: response regulator [Alphaproteobacteria bacterium]
MGRILMVDDEKDMSLLVQQRFRRHIQEGIFDFFFAQDGFEALKIIEEQPPIDVLVTDIHMPGMDGLTLIDKVSAYSPQTRSIVLSAYDDLLNLRKAMNYGAFDFISKPINMTELEETILRSLRKSKLKNFSYFAPAVLNLSQDDKSILDFLKNAGFKHQASPPFYTDQEPKAPIEDVPFYINLLFDPQETPVIVDLLTVKEGFVLLLIAVTHPLVPFTSILKIREVLKMLSLIAANSQTWVQYLQTYQRAFPLPGFSFAKCLITPKGDQLGSICSETEGNFFIGTAKKEKLAGSYALSEIATLISFEKESGKQPIPIISLKKRETFF